ncbi:MAG: EamA family transporter RarD [Pseudomonadota bacterium]
MGSADRSARSGPAFAIAAYTIWGIAPAYFVWVRDATAAEILSHRILWAIPLLAVLLTFARAWPALFALRGRKLAALFVSGALIAANWGIYIHAVLAERVLETSLGYYLNPLINVALGVVLLAERLRPGQWLAVAIAALAVAVELTQLGRLPWFGLSLALTFALYGYVRKVAEVGAIEGLMIETLLMAPFALGYLIWAHGQGLSATASDDPGLLARLALGGVVTVTPLLCFTAAALRMPLSVLGLFQYLAPTLALLLAVFAFREPFLPHQYLTFGLIWLALLVFTVEGWGSHRRAGSKPS